MQRKEKDIKFFRDSLRESHNCKVGGGFKTAGTAGTKNELPLRKG